MLKRISVVFAVIFAVVLTVGGVVSAAEKVTLIYSDATVPSEPTAKAIQKFVEEVEKISKGNIEVKYYHSGQLVSQTDQPMALMGGNIDMTNLTITYICEFMPKVGILDAPFTFKSVKQMLGFYSSDFGAKLFDDIAAHTKIRPLGCYYFGDRQISVTANVGPVHSPKDLANAKLRMPSTPLWQAIGYSLGFNPTPLASTECYMGLKTGTIEGVDMPLSQMKSLKLYESISDVSLTRHIIGNQLMCINDDKWQSLTEQQKEWILQAVDVAKAYGTELYQQASSKDVDFLKQQGIKFVMKPDIEAFRKYSQNYFKTEGKEFSAEWNWGYIDQIDTIAAE